MRKLSLFSILAIFVTLLAVGMTGCGDNGVTPTATAPTPTPTPTPAPESGTFAFASLRTGEPASGSAASMTRQQLQAARRAAKIEHESSRHATIPFADQANIYVWTGGIPGSERKINDSPAAYTSVHLEYKGTSIVFSKVIDGYNQIFTSPVPATGQTIDKPLQLTSDAEQHWMPHISADGLNVVFTKADPNSTGDVVCVISNTGGAAEECLDLSSTTPILKGVNTWHASWTPAGKIVFEAWGGSLSDEIYMVSEDGSALTQLTNNAGTKNYDECPSASSLDKTELLVDTWNDKTQHYEINSIDLTTKQRHTIAGQDPKADSWDPLENYTYGTLWISQEPTDQSLEIHGMSFGPIQLTHNTYADFFASSPR